MRIPPKAMILSLTLSIMLTDAVISNLDTKTTAHRIYDIYLAAVKKPQIKIMVARKFQPYLTELDPHSSEKKQTTSPKL